MPIYNFPSENPKRIQLPGTVGLSAMLGRRPLLGTLPSWRVIFGQQIIPIFQGGDSSSVNSADPEGYFPINAMFLESCVIKGPNCAFAEVALDDGLARCTWFLNQLSFNATDGAGKAPGPPPLGTVITIDYVIKVTATDLPNGQAKHGTIQFTVGGRDPMVPPELRGRIDSVNGILVTQVEFWARVRNDANASPVAVRLQCIADRLSSEMASFAGPIAGGGDLPDVGVSVTGATGTAGPASPYPYGGLGEPL